MSLKTRIDNDGNKYQDYDLNIKECYLGNKRIKKADIEHQMTEWHVKEYLKCSKDPIYFIEKYVKVIHVDRGLVGMKLYDYQKEVVELVTKERFSLIMQCRQSGKTAIMAPLIVWFAIFNEMKAIGIAANKAKQAKSVVSRIRICLEYLPFFLQPGCVTYNKTQLEFDNGSSIISGSSSSDNLRGDSLFLLYVDEAAFISNDMDWYTSAYPVITSGKDSRVVMTSTPKGARGMFHMLWKKAIKGLNSYATLEVPWYKVDGRDEAWKAETINNTSEKQFRQEQEIQFLGSNGTLIDAQFLEQLIDENPIEVKLEDSLFIYEEPHEDSQYVMVVDSSEGLGLDYHAFTVFKINKEDNYEVVARYRNNELSPLLYPTVIDNIGQHYNTCPVLCESNSIGYQVVNMLHEDLDYPEVLHVGLENGQQILNSPKRPLPGVKTSKSVKAIGCSNLKTIIENGRLKTNDATINDELKTFVAKGSSYQADEDCNDDTVATLFLFSWMTTQEYFKELFDGNIRKTLEKDSSELTDAFVIPNSDEYIAKETEAGFGVVTEKEVVLSNVLDNDDMSFF